MTEILRMNSEPARIFAFFPRSGKPSRSRELLMNCLDSATVGLRFAWPLADSWLGVTSQNHPTDGAACPQRVAARLVGVHPCDRRAGRTTTPHPPAVEHHAAAWHI